MSAGLNVREGQYTTRFYTPSTRVASGAVDVSSANVPTRRQMAATVNGGTGESGTLPALWWLGILIVLVALRVAYEYS